MARSRHNAFTLLEVVLAVSLVTGMMLSAFGFYQHVASLRDKIVDDLRFSRTVRLVMNRMTDELNAAVMVEPMTPTLAEWSSDRLRFTTAMLPGPSAWAIEDITEMSAPAAHDVFWVEYGIAGAENEDNEWENYGLERVCVPAVMPAGILEEDALDPYADLVAQSIRFVRFRYYGGAEATGITDEGWIDQWQGTLPPAVEITLGREPLEEGMDVEEYLELHKTYRRVVFLPGGDVSADGGR